MTVARPVLAAPGSLTMVRRDGCCQTSVGGFMKEVDGYNEPWARHRRADLTPSKGEAVACDRAGFAKSRVFPDHLCLLQ